MCCLHSLQNKTGLDGVSTSSHQSELMEGTFCPLQAPTSITELAVFSCSASHPLNKHDASSPRPPNLMMRSAASHCERSHTAVKTPAAASFSSSSSPSSSFKPGLRELLPAVLLVRQPPFLVFLCCVFFMFLFCGKTLLLIKARQSHFFNSCQRLHISVH